MFVLFFNNDRPACLVDRKDGKSSALHRKIAVVIVWLLSTKVIKPMKTLKLTMIIYRVFQKSSAHFDIMNISETDKDIKTHLVNSESL